MHEQSAFFNRNVVFVYGICTENVFVAEDIVQAYNFLKNFM